MRPYLGKGGLPGLCGVRPGSEAVVQNGRPKVDPPRDSFGEPAPVPSLHQGSYRGGGNFAAGLFRHGIFRSGFISHAILNLLWEISHPHAVSRPLVGAGCGRDCCQLFSIPAKNVASCRQNLQVYLAYSNEKRTITRSPITDSDGNISLFQLLWKGTTDKTFC